MDAFPSARSTVFTANRGMNELSRIVNDEFGWLIRSVPQETDFGIDAFLDIVTEDGAVTGKSIAVQVKSGSSYLKTKTETSFTYYGDKKHLNYYSNMPLPVILCVYNEEEGALFWVEFDALKTERTKTGWKIDVPRTNRLNGNSKSNLLKLVGEHIDHTEEMDEYWALNEKLINSGLIMYVVPKHDIMGRNIENSGSFIERISVNESLVRSVEGKVMFLIDGYNDDPRELFEIPEVARWFRETEVLNIPWFYYCERTVSGAWIKLYFACRCKAALVKSREAKGIRMEFSGRKAGKLLMRNFLRLNAITERLNMPIDENKRISFEVTDLLEIPRPTGKPH